MADRIRPIPTIANEVSAATPAASSTKDVAKFLQATKETSAKPVGRLVFALDATMSRQPTWDRASAIQSAMFEAAAKTRGLSVQLVFFRGFGECKASKWVTKAELLAGMMTGIECRGGTTQIGKVLSHTNTETRKQRVAALIFIGDAMEEQTDRLCQIAGKLGVLGTKAFMFQEGSDGATESAFREVARLTNGAYMKLGGNSAKELEELLRAVAAFASGGMKALESLGGKPGQALLEQLKR